MEIIVISDLHLTSNFDEKLFQELEKLIKKAKKVIINGDFWDSDFITFDKFIHSDWKALFPLLKEKNCTYICGNHDPRSKIDSNFLLFANEVLENFELQISKFTFLFTHGHQFNPSSTRLWNYIAFNYYIAFFSLEILNKCIYNFLHKRFNIILWGQNVNKSAKQMWKLLSKEKNRYLVTGHTHVSEVDMINKYINTGACIGGKIEYLYVKNNKFGVRKVYY